jgi:hypothetical protein
LTAVIGLAWTINKNLFDSEPERRARKKASLERDLEKAKQRWDAKWGEMKDIWLQMPRMLNFGRRGDDAWC